MPTSSQRRLHLRISGRVQGVAFRAYTQDEAELLGLCGWVRNLPDGRVEVLAEGAEDALEQLRRWCQHGPPAARVSDVEAAWSEATGEFSGFAVRH